MEDWREIEATWQGGMEFVGKERKNLQIVMGDSPTSFSPMELFLLGLAGCTGVDVVLILEKRRQLLKEFRIKVRGLRRPEYPRIYTEIEIEYYFCGKNLDVNAINQAIQLSQEKYCSASAMLRQSARITTHVTIEPWLDTG